MKTLPSTTHPKVKCWFVWTSQERHFVDTYEQAWQLSEKIFADTCRTAIVEPVYAL